VGRPTLWFEGQTRGHTLDFTLQRRSTGELFVAEMKCELEYNGYQYLRLTGPEQLTHHQLPAFKAFLALTDDSTVAIVNVAARRVDVNGTILIWGATHPDGVAATKAAHSFAEILSVEAIIEDLRTWAPDEWSNYVKRMRGWSMDLFGYLAP